MSKIRTDRQANKPKKKAKYKIKNWSKYNRALVNRGNLTLYFDEQVLENWYDDRVPQKGGKYIYSDLCIETMMTLKTLYNIGWVGEVINMPEQEVKR